MFITEENYQKQMEEIVEPYLQKRQTEMYLDRGEGRRIYLTYYTADRPAGILLISHGFTETADKYKEFSYYFVKRGYVVYLIDHAGHGRSSRMSDDLSLVHIDDYHTYVSDLLASAKEAKTDFPGLPLYLFGHSMGGGVAACAAAEEPDTFTKLILSSPMIRPQTEPIPWTAAKAAVALNVKRGKGGEYLPGGKPYDGEETFEDSAATSRERFEYYNQIRKEFPLFQTSAGSNGWLAEAVKMERFLMTKGWSMITIPVLLFQAENDTFVCGDVQEEFVKKIHKAHPGQIKLIRVPEAKHEIYFSPDEILHQYINKIHTFIA